MILGEATDSDSFISTGLLFSLASIILK